MEIKNQDLKKVLFCDGDKIFLILASFINVEKFSIINLFKDKKEEFNKKLKKFIKKRILNNISIVSDVLNPIFNKNCENIFKHNCKFKHFFTKIEINQIKTNLIKKQLFSKEILNITICNINPKEEISNLSLLSVYLEKNNKVKDLILNIKILNIESSKLIILIVKGLEKLKKFSFYFENFTLDGIQNLKNLNWKLDYLDISRCNLKLNGVSIFIDLLLKFNSVKILDLSSNLLAEKSCLLLKNFLVTNKNLINVNLCNNVINNTGINYLSESLEINDTLISLSIGKNIFDRQGVRTLSISLKLNKSLKYLDLSDLKITNKEIEFISLLLIDNKVLEKVLLNRNLISSEGFIQLVSINFTRKTTLSLKKNRIDNHGIEAFLKLIDIEGIEEKPFVYLRDNIECNSIIERILLNKIYSSLIKFD